MCRHDIVKINDIKVCRKCGLTICPSGQVFFDRALLLKRVKKHAKNG